MIQNSSGIQSNRLRNTKVNDAPLGNFGIYQAKIVNNLDASYNGIIDVELLRKKDHNSKPERTGQYEQVRYASPFGGNSIPKQRKEEYSGNESRSMNDFHRSYGMWMVPPDVGTTILVAFAEDDRSQGFYIGTVFDEYNNFTLPDTAVSSSIADGPKSLQNKKLPAGEVNLAPLNQNGAVDLEKKPYNETVANQLLQAGLLFDEVRGPSSSSARREYPSAVFGISTPGPLDKTGKTGPIGRPGEQVTVPIDRLGGSSIIMDDGDDKIVRKKKAGEGKAEYAILDEGDKDPKTNLPFNECLRFRTRTGHQILLHNTEDLIYITNSKGSAWIELTSNGKIDVYAEDSISVRTENDFNFYAERDFNFEAKRNFNLKAGQSINLENGSDTTWLSKGNMKLKVQQDLNITTDGDRIDYTDKSLTSVAKGSQYLKSGPAKTFGIVSGGNVVIHDGDLNGNTYKISMNSGSPGTPLVPEAPTGLRTYKVPDKITASLEQSPTAIKLQQDIDSIMKRVPQHEPWFHHENLDPTKMTPSLTDRNTGSSIIQENVILTPDTFKRSPTKA